MTAQFPDNIFAGRTVENRDGVTYNADETQRIFAEDINNLNDEVNAIENALGTNLSNVSGGNGGTTLVTVLAIQDAPPGSPSEGDQYIVGVGSGAWSGHDDEIAYYTGSEWTFTTPHYGWSAYVGIVLYKYFASWVRIVRSIYLPLNLLREGATLVTALTNPLSATFFGVFHYIQWGATNTDTLSTDIIRIPADYIPGSALRVKVIIQKGGASNEYFSLAIAGADKDNNGYTFLAATKTLIPSTGFVKLTFTCDTDLDQLEPNGYVYIYMSHHADSAKANFVNLVSIQLEYDAAY